MTYEEFKNIIRPKKGTTEGTMHSWYKWCRIGTWSSNLITHQMSYESSNFYIKNFSIEEYREFEKVYNYFSKLSKNKEKLEKLKEDFV